MIENNLQKSDLHCVRQFVYWERRKLFAAQEEFHTILWKIGLITNKDEGFLLANDLDSGIAILGCEANLIVLCLKSLAIFADGTYKCCPQFFTQLYTIHGFKNGSCFCLLPSKSISTSTLFNKLRRNRLRYLSIKYLQIIIIRWQNE